MSHEHPHAAEAAGGRRRPRVVVLGGGFGGVYSALALEKLLGARDDFEIALVNRENYFVFQPMLPEVISGTIGVTDVVSPIRRLLPPQAGLDLSPMIALLLIGLASRLLFGL